MTSEQHLWADVFDRPGSFVKKPYVKWQLVLRSDEAVNAWLKDRQHLFKVQYSFERFLIDIRQLTSTDLRPQPATQEQCMTQHWSYAGDLWRYCAGHCPKPWIYRLLWAACSAAGNLHLLKGLARASPSWHSSGSICQGHHQGRLEGNSKGNPGLQGALLGKVL